MSSPERRLALGLAAIRGRVNQSLLTPTGGAWRVARLARGLLREAPGDTALQEAALRLSANRYRLPEAQSLPEGGPEGSWLGLSGRSAEEIALMAQAIVTLPDGKQEPKRAAVALEVLLCDRDQIDRCRRLLSTLSADARAGAGLLWELRLDCLERPTLDADLASSWESRLQGTGDLSGADATAAKNLLTWADHRVQGSGAVSVLGGRRVALLEPVCRRYPGKSEQLASARERLGQARASAGAECHPLEVALDTMEELDASGDFDGAADALRAALDLAPGRLDLERIAEARAGLMCVPRERVSEPLPPVDLPVPAVPDLTWPEGRWTDRILGHDPEAPGDEEHLAFLEVCGHGAQAAAAWLDRGDDHGLLQAWRLRHKATAQVQTALVRQLAERIASLEDAELGEIPDLGVALHGLITPGPERRILGVRLRAANVTRSAGDRSEEDPHSPKRRLEAALEHRASGRSEAASRAAVSLLRKIEDRASLDALLDLVADLVAEAPVDPELEGAVSRHLVQDDACREGLLSRMALRGVASETLIHGLGDLFGDRETSEVAAAWAAQGWLRSATNPDDGVPTREVRAALVIDRGPLLAVAASVVAGHSEPLVAARAFLHRNPAPGAVAQTWAEQLLALAAGATER